MLVTLSEDSIVPYLTKFTKDNKHTREGVIAKKKMTACSVESCGSLSVELVLGLGGRTF